MHGLMMNMPLMISSLLRARGSQSWRRANRLAQQWRAASIATLTAKRTRAARRLANALRALGRRHTAIASPRLAWNGYRHFEIYFAVSGMGAIMHTVNPRLFPEQIAYIVNHAEDSYLFFDLTFLPLIEALAPTIVRKSKAGSR